MTKRRDRQWKCPSRNEAVPAAPGLSAGNRGYAFLILMMMVTILLISLTASLPSIYTEGQREKEEELIFRGNQYARAILFFHNKFGRYPSTVEELVKKTNGVRFLRQAYTDPMTLKGNWRFIHANAAGMVIDSKIMTLPTGATSNNGSNPLGQQNSEISQSSAARGFGFNTPDQPNLQPTQTSQNSDSQPGEAQSGAAKAGDSSSSDNQMHGGFIVGVASTSTKTSIRVYNNQTRYDKWEFLAVGQGVANLLAPGGNIGGQPTSTGQPGSGQNPGQNPGIGPGGIQGSGPGVPTPPTPPTSPDTPQ